jgi:hypothetical protein
MHKYEDHTPAWPRHKILSQKKEKEKKERRE